MTVDVTVLRAHTARLRDHPFLQAHLRIRQLLREGRGVRPVLVSCILRVMTGFLAACSVHNSKKSSAAVLALVHATLLAC